MNGYVIARLMPGEAEYIFTKQQVRHVALMDDGTTFIAFDGEIPVETGLILEVEDVKDSIPWARPQVRSRIENDAPEYLGLYAAEDALKLGVTEQMSVVAGDMVLLLSHSPLAGRTIWTAVSERIMDKRLLVGAE